MENDISNKFMQFIDVTVTLISLVKISLGSDKG